MKKCYKNVLGMALAVVMLFAACVPAFAAAKNEAVTNSSSDFITSIASDTRGHHEDGEVLTIKAYVKNCAKEPRDILVKVRASSFMRILTINGERDLDRNITFENVQPGESKLIAVEVKLSRAKLPIFDHAYNLMLGELTVVLFRFVDTLSLNLVTEVVRYGDDTQAAIAFKAEDVTPAA